MTTTNIIADDVLDEQTVSVTTSWTDKLRYSKSFLAKLLLSDNEVKTYYAALATKLLDFNKVKARSRWSGVSFSVGRTAFARVGISGKTLCVYFATNPSLYADGKYKAKDVGNVKKYEKTPALFKIKSEGALRFVLRVADETAALLQFTERTDKLEPLSAKSFAKESFDNLLTRGLIRVLKGKFAAPEEVEESENPDWTDKLRYSKSFLAKIALSAPEVKQYYAELATKLLDYDKVKARTRWSGVGFFAGRTPFARVNVVGKTLCVYFATDPSLYADGKYKAKDVGNVKKYEKTPALFKIKSEGALRFVLRVADETAALLQLSERKNKLAPVSAKDFPSDTFENLLNRGLIRLLKNIVARSAYEEDVTDDLQTELQTESYAQSEDDGVYAATVKSVSDLTDEYKAYGEILEMFSDGDMSVKNFQKLMLTAVDETWIKQVENTLSAIDMLIRNPTHFIAETEEVLPIEMTRKITGRSIAHLSQHTNYITTDGDEIIPKKMLNVFREDSLFTYENKFLNTLIARLHLFVSRRYRIATTYGVDEKTHAMQYSADFIDGDKRGKVTVSVQLSEKCSRTDRRVQPDLDLRKRIERINDVLDQYAKSDFVLSMEKRYVRPPIMRTNAIVKNKYFRQCLNLWEFIESYEDSGYGLTVEEKTYDVGDSYADALAKMAAMQYLTFKHNVFGDYANNVELATSVTPLLRPRIVERPAEHDRDNYDTVTEQTSFAQALSQEQLKLDLQVALAADDLCPDVVEQLLSQAALDSAKSGDENEFEFAGIRYQKTFHAKIRLTSDQNKQFFAEIANRLLSFNKVKVRQSNRFASFNYGRNTIARMTVTGKTLQLYMALQPDGIDAKYHLRNVSDKKTYEDTPGMLRVRSNRALKYANELIDLMASVYDFVPAKKDGASFSADDFAEKSFDEMIALGWIKAVERQDPFATTEKEAVEQMYGLSASTSSEQAEEKDELPHMEPAEVEFVSPSAIEIEQDQAEQVAATIEHETLPDVVQIAPDEYARPTDYGVDDATNFIEDIGLDDDTPKKKSFWASIFGKRK